MRYRAETYRRPWTISLGNERIRRRRSVDRQGGEIGHAVAQAADFHRVGASARPANIGEGDRCVGFVADRCAVHHPLITKRPGPLRYRAETYRRPWTISLGNERIRRRRSVDRQGG